MRCHYCWRAADVEVESDGVVLGLCEHHLRERVEALVDEGGAAALRDVLDAEDS